MRLLTLLFCSLICWPLSAAPKTDLTIPLQEMRSQLDHLNYQFNGQKVEVEILLDKISMLQQEVHSLTDQMGQQTLKDKEGLKDQLNSTERRLTQIEKIQETLITDLKQIKSLINESALQLSTSEKQLQNLDKQVSQDIKTLKKAVETIMSIIQKGGKETVSATHSQEETREKIGEIAYKVKPGDSLGKIAQEHHIDIKILKEANNLTSDKIKVGQKITIPQ